MSVHCPQPIHDLPGWLLWRYEQFPGEKKPRKVPYYADGTGHRRTNGTPADLSHLLPFQLALAALTEAQPRYAGLGFATLAQWGLTVLDFDNCVAPDGSVVADVLALASETYCELSPSGKGVHAFVRGNGYGNRKSPATAERYGLEAFTSSGYVTYTGKPLPVCEALGKTHAIAHVHAADALVHHRWPTVTELTVESVFPLGLATDVIARALVHIRNNDLPYEDYGGKPSWIEVGMAVHCETRGSEAGFQLWDEWSATSRKYNGTEHARARWASFGARGDTTRAITGRSLARWSGQGGYRVPITLPTALEAFDDIADEVIRSHAPSGEAPINNRFPAVTAHAWSMRPAPRWIIRDVIPDAEIAVIFGPSGAGKSFVALDMALAIAMGKDWQGQPVRQGQVAYLAAEGAGGVSMRLKAYTHYHDVTLSDVPLKIIPHVPNLLLRSDAVEIAKSIGQGVALSMIDTVAATTAGANENSGEDMGLLLSHCKMIARYTRAPVLLVHHAGKDLNKGMRGWSGLGAAVDAQIEVTRVNQSLRRLRTVKQKDGTDDLAMGFKLLPVNLGSDEWSRVVTSCVVIAAPLTAAEVPVPMKRNVMDVVSVLRRTFDDMSGLTGEVEEEMLIEHAASELPPPFAAQRDTRILRVANALSLRIDAGDYTRSAGVIRLPDIW